MGLHDPSIKFVVMVPYLDPKRGRNGTNTTKILQLLSLGRISPGIFHMSSIHVHDPAIKPSGTAPDQCTRWVRNGANIQDWLKFYIFGQLLMNFSALITRRNFTTNLSQAPSIGLQDPVKPSGTALDQGPRWVRMGPKCQYTRLIEIFDFWPIIDSSALHSKEFNHKFITGALSIELHDPPVKPSGTALDQVPDGSERAKMPIQDWLKFYIFGQ